MDLYEALSLLGSPQEFQSFFQDLCSPSEKSALEERWKVCLALKQGHSYREIRRQLGVSLTTIQRVARCLAKDGGYQHVLRRRDDQV